MFDKLGRTVKEQREKLEQKAKWLEKFRTVIKEREFLSDPFSESRLISEIDVSIPSTTKIAGVDGGLISEAMTGFDLALYRAVAAIFRGIGKKVEATYLPSFDPEPDLFFSPSLGSRQEFSRIATLKRLYAEYSVAKHTIEKENPTVLFLDGKVTPLSSDFTINSSKGSLLQQSEMDVKMIYRELVNEALDNEVLLCGVVKDTRSRVISQHLQQLIPDLVRNGVFDSSEIKGWTKVLPDLQDTSLASNILEVGQRTAWLSTSSPVWLPPKLSLQIRTCLVKPIADDIPTRLEILVGSEDEFVDAASDMALAAFSKLCQHGLPLAIPTVILEADERTKLRQDHLEAIVDQISIHLGIPKDKLRKRRFFTTGIENP